MKPKQIKAYHDGWEMTPGYINGYRRGFLRGQKFSEAIAQHPAEVCGAFFLLGTVVDRLFRFVG